jgi:hypothetical protein
MLCPTLHTHAPPPSHTEHKYKDADLSWGALKGSDRAAARALATCPGLDAYLVPLTRTISGTAYYNSPCRWKRGWWDDEEDHEEDLKGPHEMDEVGGLMGFLWKESSAL